MPVFRRSSAGATEGQAQDSQGTQPAEAPAKSKPPAQTGKGRPTPKRSEAEANRYRSITGSTTSGRGRPATATPGRKLTPEEKTKARTRPGPTGTGRCRPCGAARSGRSPRATAARSSKLARDYVDAHRRPSEFYMYALILLVIGLVAGKSHSGDQQRHADRALVIIMVIVRRRPAAAPVDQQAGGRAAARRIDPRHHVLRRDARPAAAPLPHPGAAAQARREVLGLGLAGVLAVSRAPPGGMGGPPSGLVVPRGDTAASPPGAGTSGRIPCGRHRRG